MCIMLGDPHPTLPYSGLLWVPGRHASHVRRHAQVLMVSSRTSAAGDQLALPAQGPGLIPSALLAGVHWTAAGKPTWRQQSSNGLRQS